MTARSTPALAKNEMGFTMTLGSQAEDLVEVDRLTRAVSE